MNNNLNVKKKRHIAASILIGIWIAIKTIFLVYAVAFTVAATYLLVKGYYYFDEAVMKPLNEVKALKENNPEESAYMTQYRKELRDKGESDTLIRKFVPLDSIPKNLINTVLAVEDDGFYMHPGFSLDAIVEAIEYNKSVNANKRGASTITQQLAKNMFLTPEKSFERKVKELGYTLLMEKYLGKDRILELYLNYAQWGKNIFGCEAATNFYYKKSCKDLTLIESARMAACLAMPTKLTPHYTKSLYMGKRITIIANNMYIRNKLDDAGYMVLTGTYPPGKEEEMEEGN
ncbi:MAG: monofunctional biosynthetic peptidoglycan transglycosylase [Chitinispirillales bacterium]|jgi:monofunctional biosynthetic peptidoglycan transglycosylase|nr:monofunctional biosynthetic peptidoglycan transglycosylase [Chitinispirillales bacterium]